MSLVLSATHACLFSHTWCQESVYTQHGWSVECQDRLLQRQDATVY